MKLAAHFVPFDRHRHRCARRWTHAVGRHHQLARTVLEGVDIDLAFSLADRARRRRDVGVLIGDEPREQHGELQALRIGQLPAQRQHDVQTRLSRRLDERRHFHVIAQLPHRLGERNDVREGCFLRVEIDETPVGLREIGDATHPDVQRNRAQVDEIDE